MWIVEKIKDKGKEFYYKGNSFVTEHPYKTAATFLAIATVASLTAAYFLSPAYATFVGTVGTKAATLVSPAITAMSAFAIAHPLVASLVVLAAVAAIIAATVLAYKNSNKAVQIEGVKEAVLNAYEKDGDKPKVNDGKLLANDKDPLSALYEVAEIVGLVQTQKQ